MRALVLLLLVLPLAAAQAPAAPAHAEADAQEGRVEATASTPAGQRPPSALDHLPGASTNATPERVALTLRWSLAWDPAACAPVEAAAEAEAQDARTGPLAHAQPLPCAPAVPASSPALPAAWLEVPPLPRAPRLSTLLPRPEASIAAPDSRALVAEGEARALAVPETARVAAEAWTAASTPAARVEAAAAVGEPLAAASAPRAPDAALHHEAAAAPPLAVHDAPREAPPLAPRGTDASTATSDAPPRPLPRGAVRPIAAPVAAETATPPEARWLAPAAALGLALVLAAFALYQRVRRPAALDHEGRRRLYDACVAAGAPATAGELAARTGIARKTAEYHLLYLARLGLLAVERAPDAPRRFAPHARRALAPEPLDARLLRALQDRPGLPTAELAAQLGETRSRVERRAKDLVLSGALECRRERGARRFYASRA